MDQQELFEDFELVYHAEKGAEWKLDRVLFYLDLHKKLNNHSFRAYDLAILYFRSRDTKLVSLFLEEMNRDHARKMAEAHVDDDKHAYQVSCFIYQLMQDQKKIDETDGKFQVFYYDIWSEAFTEKEFKRINTFLLAFEEIEKRKQQGIFVA
jgi:hypothetical protein